jgi:hypothetical protein
VTGVAWIEIFPEGDDLCHHWIEYTDGSGNPPNGPRQVTLTEQSLREQVPEDKRKRKMKLEVFSCGGGKHTVEDFSALASKEAKMKLPDGRPGYKSSKVGFSQMEGSQPQESIFGIAWKNKDHMLAVKVYHGNCLDGLEFFYEDGKTELFGKRGGKPGGSSFTLDHRMGETIIGFNVRAGMWLDGIQILTSTGRRSEMFGNATGGSGYVFSRGYGLNLRSFY